MYKILIALLFLFSLAYAEDQVLPKPDGDLQYLLFAVFVFLGWLAYIGMKIWTKEKPTEEHEDHNLLKDVLENANQISALERSHEFQEKLFEEHKKRTEENINEIFRKIEDMDVRLGNKIDNLVTAIIQGKEK